jgi:hypothetical protein
MVEALIGPGHIPVDGDSQVVHPQLWHKRLLYPSLP